MDTGSKIKELRLKKGLTQKQLGELCGMADSAIRRYENGRAKPKLETLHRIIHALNLSTDEVKEIYLLSCDDFGSFWDNNTQKQNEEELLDNFRKLNTSGQKEAIKRTAELTEIKKYIQSEPSTSDILRDVVEAFDTPKPDDNDNPQP